MHTLIQDIRYGFRLLLNKPGFTLIAVLTLALGIGGNTAIFSVVNAVLLQPLPFPDSDRLVFVFRSTPEGRQPRNAYPDIQDWREQTTQFTDLSIWTPQSVNLTGQDEPGRVRGGFVSTSFFEVMNVQPATGRGFLPDEEQIGSGYVVVINHGLWQGRFGGDPDIIGKQLTLNNELFTVVGIMPEGFRFPWDNIEVWMPFQHWPPFNLNRNNGHGAAVGRIKPGVSMEAAQAEMKAIAARLAQQYPESNADRSVELVPMKETVVGNLRSSLLILMGAVGLVLLIACTNVANLLLSRSMTRQKELAMRAALGAGRSRLVRQLLTETVLLSLMGGMFGLAIGVWGIDVLSVVSADMLPGGMTPTLDGNVLVFTLGMAVLTGLIFGLGPALRISNTNINTILKDEGASSSATMAKSRFRNVMTVFQVAMALVLLIGAGLLIRSFSRLTQVETGFQSESLLTLEYRLPGNKYTEGDQQWQFHYEAAERIRALPGVIDASAVIALPYSGNGFRSTFILTDRPEPPPGQEPNMLYNVTDPHFFDTIGIPLLRGRGITFDDKPNTQPIAVVNKTMVDRYWPDEDPIGKTIRLQNTVGRRGEEVTAMIVGVVGNIRHYSLDENAMPQVYIPYTQHPYIFSTLVVRTNGDPLAMAGAVKDAVWSIDPDQPMWKIRTVDFLIERSLGPARFIMNLMTGFSLVALLLASIGIYGVISYAVNQRVHEIGIRMAIGADTGDILRLVVGHGMLMIACGVGLGLVGAFLLTRSLESLLYEVNPADPLVFGGIALLLSTVGLLACYLPARRATRVNPIQALRWE